MTLYHTRFQGRETCSCGQADVTEQFTSLAWDNFSSQVLSSLYNMAPITMHCNQSTAELFPVSRGTKCPLCICECSARACMPLVYKGLIRTHKTQLQIHALTTEQRSLFPQGFHSNIAQELDIVDKNNLSLQIELEGSYCPCVPECIMISHSCTRLFGINTKEQVKSI